jgi:predicted membrane protein
MLDVSSLNKPVDSLGGIITIVYEQLEKRPLVTLKLFAAKAMRSWYGTDSRRFESEILLLQVPYLVLLLWGTRQAWRLGGIPKRLAVSVWLIVFYFWAMTILVVSIVRYMTPAIGLLFLLMPGALPGVRPRET